MVVKSLGGIVTIEAACGDNKHNHNQNRLLNLLRRNVGVSATGDFEFTVRAVPRSVQSWEEFTKEFDEWKDEGCVLSDGDDSATEGYKEWVAEGIGYFIDAYERDHNLLLGKKPADLLWDLTNYGDIGWDWGGMIHFDYNDPIEPEGVKHIQERVKPDARPADI